MTVQLDPRIADKIRQFARRRRLLILLRGVCALLTLGCVALASIAFLDYLVFLEDWMRYALTGVAYVLTAVVLYVTSIRYLSHRANMRELARLFETANPELREDLLSAVELADPTSQRGLDSPEFRRLLQSDVAGRIDDLKIESVLPARLIMRWLRAVAIVVVIALALLAIPKFKFAKLMLRAAAPMANVERVSDIRIVVVEPKPAEGVVPQGDTVPVIVEVSNDEIERVMLESIPEDGQSNRVMMDPVGQRKFTTVINIGRQSLKYRVRAGTAQTRFHQLTALPRPQVTMFQKSFHYPIYSKQKKRVVTDISGDIEALQGSRVDMVISTDQPVRKASIKLETANGKRDIPLEVRNGRQLHASLDISESATYRIHLVSAKTGFDNKFSPRYEIRAQADLVPTITFSKPQGDLSVPRDEIIDIRGLAKDDLGLKSVDLSYKVNGGPGESFNILSDPEGMEIELKYRWDLVDLALRPGDEIVMKLICTDLKGSKGNSSVRRITITSVGFDPDRMEQLKKWYGVRNRLDAVRKSSSRLQKRATAAVQQFAGAADAGARQQLFLNLATAMQRTVEQSNDVQSQIKDVLPALLDSQGSADLVLSGRVNSRILHQSFEIAGKRLDQGQDLPKTQQQIDIQYGQNLIGAGAANSDRLTRLFDRLLAYQEAKTVRSDLDRLLMEQKQISQMTKEKANGLLSVERIHRRQKVILDNMKELSDTLKSLDKHLPNSHELRYIQRNIKQADARTNRILAKGGRIEYGSFSCELFADKVLKVRKMVKDDPRIDHRWSESPSNGLPKDGFSVRWTGTIVPRKTGLYRFYLPADDGVRLWVGDKLLLDHWKAEGLVRHEVEMELKAGRPYPLKLEMFDEKGHAICKLTWSVGKHQMHVPAVKRVHYDLGPVESELRSALAQSKRLVNQAREKAGDARRQLREMLGNPAEAAARAVQAMKRAGELSKQENVTKEQKQEAVQKAEEQLKAATKELKDRAELEEMRQDLDTAFVNDLSQTASALEKLDTSATTAEQMQNKAADVKIIEDALKTMEALHKLKRATNQLQDIATSERWDEAGKEKARKTSEAWEKVKSELKQMKTDAPKDEATAAHHVAQVADDALKSNESREIDREMKKRGERDKVEKPVTDAAERLASTLAQEQKKLRESIAAARQAVSDLSPTLSEQLDGLEKMARSAQKASEELAGKSADGEPVQNVQDSSRELQKMQEKLNDKLEDMRAAVRRDANAQDLSTKEGRERARDADDALAMLHQPPPKAEDLLRKAANSNQQPEQESALKQAGQQQEKIADALKQLSDHYKNVESGNPDESRQALREKEKELGIANSLDKQYEKLADLAAIQPDNVPEAVGQLENRLATDKSMQQELKQIANETVDQAANNLKQAAQNESTVADNVNDMQKRTQSQERSAAKQLSDMAKKLNEMTRQQLPQLANEAKKQGVNSQKVEQSKSALQQAANSLPRTPSVEQGKEAGKQLSQAANQMKQAENALRSAAQDAQNKGKQQVAGKAQQAANQARDLAKQASSLAQQMSRADGQLAKRLSSEENRQDGTQRQTAQAAGQLDRAARHQERLGQPQGEQLSALAQQAQQLAQNEMEQAKQSLASSQKAQQAQPAVNAAEKAANAAAKAMSDFQQQQGPQRNNALPPTEASKWLARALDQLDQAQQARAAAQRAQQAQAQAEAQAKQNSQNAAQAQQAKAAAQQAQAQAQQAKSQAQQAMQQAQSALAQAQKAQAQSMAQSRSRKASDSEGQDNEGETEFKGDSQIATNDKPKKDEDWTKLPKRLARELKSAKQANVPEQYRSMVNTYFKVIAERSRKKTE